MGILSAEPDRGLRERLKRCLGKAFGCNLLEMSQPAVSYQRNAVMEYLMWLTLPASVCTPLYRLQTAPCSLRPIRGNSALAD